MILFLIMESVLVIKVILCLCLQPISVAIVVVGSLWFFCKRNQSAAPRPKRYKQSIRWNQVFFQSKWLKLMFVCFFLNYKLVFMIKCKASNWLWEVSPNKIGSLKKHKRTAELDYFKTVKANRLIWQLLSSREAELNEQRTQQQKFSSIKYWFPAVYCYKQSCGQPRGSI